MESMQIVNHIPLGGCVDPAVFAQTAGGRLLVLMFFCVAGDLICFLPASVTEVTRTDYRPFRAVFQVIFSTLCMCVQLQNLVSVAYFTLGIWANII